MIHKLGAGWNTTEFLRNICLQSQAFIFPNSGQGEKSKLTTTRWFKVTFLSPNVAGHQQPLKGSLFHHPKKVTSRTARYYFILLNLKIPEMSSLVWTPPHFKFFSAPKNDEHLVIKNQSCLILGEFGGRLIWDIKNDGFGNPDISF